MYGSNASCLENKNQTNISIHTQLLRMIQVYPDEHWEESLPAQKKLLISEKLFYL